MTHSPNTIVVVGNGMVGHRFCERLVEHGIAARARVVVFGDEPRPAYDRVHLTDYFTHRSADALSLATTRWYAEHAIELHTDTRIARVERARREVVTARGDAVAYRALVLATGSSPFVPPIRGIERPGVFVYRTIEDLDAILAWARTARRAAVIGGGLLGLEAARALQVAGLETHVLEAAPRLMPRQLDTGGAALLERTIRALGVHVHTGVRIDAIVGTDVIHPVHAVQLVGAEAIEVDLVIV
ncbi:MAG: NAD(P)/FAD-dependent oxidoreductase, partial [Myxococcales bacterium]|nr:NAD(P)/FAD-dependent oxidoreductase [Myxococcales bacterium]